MKAKISKLNKISLQFLRFIYVIVLAPRLLFILHPRVAPLHRFIPAPNAEARELHFRRLSVSPRMSGNAFSFQLSSHLRCRSRVRATQEAACVLSLPRKEPGGGWGGVEPFEGTTLCVSPHLGRSPLARFCRSNAKVCEGDEGNPAKSSYEK